MESAAYGPNQEEGQTALPTGAPEGGQPGGGERVEIAKSRCSWLFLGFFAVQFLHQGAEFGQFPGAQFAFLREVGDERRERTAQGAVDKFAHEGAQQFRPGHAGEYWKIPLALRRLR